MGNQQKIAFAWAEEYLTRNGYNIQAPPEIVRDMPWSRVIRFSTSKGLVYFKHMAAAFSIEPLVLEFLSKLAPQSVTEVIASNRTLSCFLMKDAGRPFRERLKNNYQINCVCNALQMYAQIQFLSASHVDALLSMGLPDWRLKKIPDLYLEFAGREQLLKADGLTATEIETLQSIYPQVSALCEKLSEYGIPDTLEHGDFHDNNILIQNGHLTFNDWEDASISHPFFSLAAFLNSAGYNHGVKETDERYLKAQNAYLEKWSDYGSNDQLLEAFELAKTLRFFQFALSFSRIQTCPGAENFSEYRGYIAESLRELMKNLMECKTDS